MFCFSLTSPYLVFWNVVLVVCSLIFRFLKLFLSLCVFQYFRMKKHFLTACWTFLAIIPLWLLCYYILDVTTLGAISGSRDDADIINYFYSIENIDNSGKGDTTIVLVDLAGIRSRDEIGDVITRIAACQPQKIALDIIFPSSASDNQEENARLEQIIATASNVVTACRIIPSENSFDPIKIEHSFFTHSTKIPYGATNSMMSKLIYSFTIDNDTIFSFPAVIAGKTKTDNRQRYVNYSNKQFLILSAMEDFFEEDFKNKIVLLGDLSDSRDYHDIPFILNGSRRVPGTLLTAYAVSTILKDNGVVKINDTICLIVAALLIYIFAFFYILLNKKRKMQFWQRLYEIGVILLLTLIFYLLFTWFNRMFNLVYAIMGFAVAGFAYDFVNLLLNKKKKKR